MGQEDASWLLWGMLERFDMDVVEFENLASFEQDLKNGANTWKDFSEGGCALVTDVCIAKHYCTKSELKKTHNGEKAPNERENWLGVQARALWQAALMIRINLVTE